MAWTAGVTRTTGDLITAAQWNSFLGASGSLDYLKTQTDKLDDVSFSQPARALDTIYQNSTKIRIVTITGIFNAAEDIWILIGSGTPPGTYIAGIEWSLAENVDLPITFVVPPNWYYEAEATGTPQINKWGEWDLH